MALLQSQETQDSSVTVRTERHRVAFSLALFEAIPDLSSAAVQLSKGPGTQPYRDPRYSAIQGIVSWPGPVVSYLGPLVEASFRPFSGYM